MLVYPLFRERNTSLVHTEIRSDVFGNACASNVTWKFEIQKSDHLKRRLFH
jgi:hypothetical protein